MSVAALLLAAYAAAGFYLVPRDALLATSATGAVRMEMKLE